jgi:hypothetical protein
MVSFSIFFICLQNSADVVACNRDPGTDIITSFDAWNIQSSKGNQIDTIQDVVLFSGGYNNGRITCRYEE